MSSAVQINYAHAFGIETLAPAIVFVVLYAPLFAWFLFQSIRRPTYVYFVLTFFCTIRIAAFAIRAALAQSESAGEKLSLLIADQILFGVGFFGLLYSAYTLVLDRELLLNYTPPSNILSRISGNRRIFRLILIVGVALGIAGASQASSTDPQNGKSLKIASTFIFLALTVLLAYRTLLLTKEEHLTMNQNEEVKVRTFGRTYGATVLCVIAILLLVREVFTAATAWDAQKQNNEHLWYPLYALPEILAVAIYAVPSLVPPRSELPK